MHGIVKTKFIEQALHASTSPSVLDSLSEHEDMEVRWRVAINPNTSQDTLRKMVQDKNNSVLHCLAQNTNIPHDVIESLFFIATNRGGVMVAQGLASNPRTKPNMLESLSKIKDKMVRFLVGSNPNTTIHILKELAKKSKYFVRSGVAKNPSITDEISWLLARSKNLDVIGNLCENSSTHPDVLDILAEKYADNDRILMRIAKNTSAKASTLEYVFDKTGDLTIFVKQMLALNPNLPPHLMEKISQHPHSHVRYYLSRNPSITRSVLKKLLADEDPYIRESAEENQAAKEFECFI